MKVQNKALTDSCRCLVATILFCLTVGFSASARHDRSDAGVISGTVVSADGRNSKIPGVVVTLSGSSLAHTLVAVTNDDGAFAFRSLPEGRFSLSAAKASYVKTSYGSTIPGRPGTSIPISPEQSTFEVTLHLPKGAVVAGVIRDSSGRAIQDVTVSAIRVSPNNRAASELSQSVLTSDRGEFRLFGLQPGSFVIVASAPVFGSMREMSLLTTAGLNELLADVRAGREVTAKQTIEAQAGRLVLVPLFFPGVPSPSEAQRIELHMGEERTGIDFMLQPVSSGTIEGEISSSDGGPLPPVNLRLLAKAPPIPFRYWTVPSLTGAVGPDGRFRYSPVVRGTYLLTAAANRGTTSQAPLWAEAEVDFSGVDVVGLRLVMRRGVEVSGTVRFVGTHPPAAKNYDGLRVVLMRQPERNGSLFAADLTPQSYTAPVGSDGRFHFAGVPSGSYSVSTNVRAETGWQLRSIQVAGKDTDDNVLSTNIDATSTTIDVVFTDQAAELRGRLELTASDLPGEFDVIIFPTARELWHAGSRRIRSARPATDGTFIFSGLPAGVYFVGLLTGFNEEDLDDFDLLRILQDSSVTVRINEGTPSSLRLRIPK